LQVLTSVDLTVYKVTQTTKWHIKYQQEKPS